jgi:hypothetical protein
VRTVDLIQTIGFKVRRVCPLQHTELSAIPLQPVDRGIEDRKIARRSDRQCMRGAIQAIEYPTMRDDHDTLTGMLSSEACDGID